MKNVKFFKVLLIAVFAVAGMAACSEELDGGWDPMEWSAEGGVGKDGSISVPAAGGTYTFACKNYGGIWLSDIRVGGELLEYDGFYHAQGKWISIDTDKNILTVTISPNDSGEARTATVGVTAGDIFDYFDFKQN